MEDRSFSINPTPQPDSRLALFPGSPKYNVTANWATKIYNLIEGIDRIRIAEDDKEHWTLWALEDDAQPVFEDFMQLITKKCI